jgi:formamidopyrimidine-DNA glycosylase
VPELPEVEIARWRFVEAVAERHVVDAVAEAGPPLVGAPRTLRRVLRGARFGVAHRRGKQLAIEVHAPDGRARALALHLGMTGKFERGRAGEAAPRGARVGFALDDGSVLHFVDVRRLGRVALVAGGPDAVFDGLGPDALTIALDPPALAARFAGARAPVKVALLDQARVAGVGNIYAIEALWAAGIDPRVPAGALDVAAWSRVGQGLDASMRATLALGARDPAFRYLSEGGDDVFQVYGHEASPCPRCHTGVRRIVQAGRSTYFCPSCQRDPLVTSDPDRAPRRERPARATSSSKPNRRRAAHAR